MAPYPGQLAALKAKLLVKAKKEEVYNKYVTEIANMIASLNSFLEEAEVALAEADSIPKDSPDDSAIENLTNKLLGFTTTSEHHLGGAKAAKGRFTSM